MWGAGEPGTQRRSAAPTMNFVRNRGRGTFGGSHIDLRQRPQVHPGRCEVGRRQNTGELPDNHRRPHTMQFIPGMDVVEGRSKVISQGHCSFLREPHNMLRHPGNALPLPDSATDLPRCGPRGWTATCWQAPASSPAPAKNSLESVDRTCSPLRFPPGWREASPWYVVNGSPLHSQFLDRRPH